MAVITLNIPDDQHKRVFNSFATKYGYESRAEDAETKEEFCKRKLIEQLHEAIDHVECSAISDRAVTDHEAKIRREVLIT